MHVQEGRQHTVNHFQVRGVALPVRGGGGREGGGSSAYVDTTATARPLLHAPAHISEMF